MTKTTSSEVFMINIDTSCQSGEKAGAKGDGFAFANMYQVHVVFHVIRDFPETKNRYVTVP